MTAILCEKCGDYGWDMVDGVCSVCLDGHKQAQPEPTKPTCAYCGKTIKYEFPEEENEVTK